MKFTHKECPLHSPLKVGNKTLHTREWIEIQDGERLVDLAPLPGLHTEDLEESLRDFKAGVFSTPSALFAKEAFELLPFQEEESLVNKLDFIDTDIDPLTYFEKWNKLEVVKLKLGRNPIKEEIIWLNKLLTNNNKKVSFRLDANRSLTLEEFNIFLNSIPLDDIQYFEEPLKDATLYNRIKNDKFSIALDENIALRDSIKVADYLVIKPTFNLSLKETLLGLERALISIIISSSFDPPNNLKLLHYLGSKTSQACGLDTLKYFNLEQIISTPL